MLRGTRGESRPGEGAAILPSTTKSLWANDRRRPLFFFLVCAYWCLSNFRWIFFPVLCLFAAAPTRLSILCPQNRARDRFTRGNQAPLVLLSLFFGGKEKEERKEQSAAAALVFFFSRALVPFRSCCSPPAQRPLSSLSFSSVRGDPTKTERKVVQTFQRDIILLSEGFFLVKEITQKARCLWKKETKRGGSKLISLSLPPISLSRL